MKAMARNRGKKALYEVISRTQPRAGSVGPVQQYGAPEAKKDEPVGAGQEMSSQWPRRPRILQFIAGRIEVSVPYQLGIAVLLGLVLVVLAAYRLGQTSYSGSRRPGGSSLKVLEDNEKETTDFTMGMPDELPEVTETIETVEPGGDNVIIVVEFDRRADLVPVQQHYRDFGIETEIVPKGDGRRYYLWTKKRYESVNTPGTPGYEAMKEIAEVGKLYKAPKGCETFKPRLFGDCYGMKVSE